MGFLIQAGRVSRRGQWRFRHTFRAADLTGRTDPTDDGLYGWGDVTAAVLTVTKRPPYPGWANGCDPAPVLSASYPDGNFRLLDPGGVEVVFPNGWSASVPPGLYDLRIEVTIGPETAVIFDEPVEFY